MSSTPMIFVMKVEKLVRDACEVYLAFVVTNKENNEELSDIPVVWEFSDVFPEELMGLPLVVAKNTIIKIYDVGST